jgi:hypothetical protein
MNGKPVNIAKENALVFIRDFILEGKDENIPLSETYLLYVEYVKKRFPNDPTLSAQVYSRVTTDYFYKKAGATNRKAISLEQMEEDLKRKLQNIHIALTTVQRIKKNREDLILSMKDRIAHKEEIVLMKL